jgi:histidinol-phosphate aminotransferase
VAVKISRPEPAAAPRGTVVRLDNVGHPYGPSPAALEAADAYAEGSAEILARCLRRRLGEQYRVPESAVFLLSDIDSAMRRAIDHLPGPLVGFPPSAAMSTLEAWWPARERIAVARGVHRLRLFDGEEAADLPADGVAVADSPTDPLGALLAFPDAVRVARASRSLIVDERYAEFAGFSLLPLALEFDNVVVFRSFEIWAGLQALPVAWAVASPSAARLAGLRDDAIAPARLAAAIATLDGLDAVRATLKLVLEERSRLYRFLRRFSLFEPLPSWAPFLACRVTMVERRAVVEALARQRVEVHTPVQEGLERFIRFGIGTRSEMERLRAAVRDLAPELLP